MAIEPIYASSDDAGDSNDDHDSLDGLPSDWEQDGDDDESRVNGYAVNPSVEDMYDDHEDPMMDCTDTRNDLMAWDVDITVL
eukprot:CAMPEP_0201565538 /NCGR_PEP_ID=MMETSP0190_2-20130828/4708_1 /ASSEMBLY_ACC=CAM_ASM_000263 /TAXON_ID=37353 /ORGANISM="Rosalina sp." /LENGTH=81 /DNA_ID=CAMNT_0047983149 /DNA_START=313 /DNA_END=559 /DNA_ORIENTATION=+